MVTISTEFHKTRVPLHKWFYAIYSLGSTNRVTGHQLARTLGVCYKTAWFMLYRIRETIRLESRKRARHGNCADGFLASLRNGRRARRRLACEVHRFVSIALMILKALQ
jgi:hypothetical protein